MISFIPNTILLGIPMAAVDSSALIASVYSLWRSFQFSRRLPITLKRVFFIDFFFYGLLLRSYGNGIEVSLILMVIAHFAGIVSLIGAVWLASQQLIEFESLSGRLIFHGSQVPFFTVIGVIGLAGVVRLMIVMEWPIAYLVLAGAYLIRTMIINFLWGFFLYYVYYYFFLVKKN